MIRDLLLTDRAGAARVVQIQRAAYEIEAELIGFDDIPPLRETAEDVLSRTDLRWLGAYDGDLLVGIVAFTVRGGVLEIDRLAVHPDHARRGWGRSLIRALPEAATTEVSTGAANRPGRDFYEALGFEFIRERDIEDGLRIAEYRRFADA